MNLPVSCYHPHPLQRLVLLCPNAVDKFTIPRKIECQADQWKTTAERQQCYTGSINTEWNTSCIRSTAGTLASAQAVTKFFGRSWPFAKKSSAEPCNHHAYKEIHNQLKPASAQITSHLVALCIEPFSLWLCATSQTLFTSGNSTTTN